MFNLHTRYKKLLKRFDYKLDQICKILVRDELDEQQRKDYDYLATQIIREKTSLMREFNNMKRGVSK